MDSSTNDPKGGGSSDGKGAGGAAAARVGKGKGTAGGKGRTPGGTKKKTVTIEQQCAALFPHSMWQSLQKSTAKDAGIERVRLPQDTRVSIINSALSWLTQRIWRVTRLKDGQPEKIKTDPETGLKKPVKRMVTIGDLYDIARNEPRSAVLYKPNPEYDGKQLSNEEKLKESKKKIDRELNAILKKTSRKMTAEKSRAVAREARSVVIKKKVPKGAKGRKPRAA